MKRRSGFLMGDRDDVPGLVCGGDQVAAVIGNDRVDFDRRKRKSPLDGSPKLGYALPRAGRGKQRRGLQPPKNHARRFVDEVGLVEDDDLRQVTRSDIADDVTNGSQLRRGVGV